MYYITFIATPVRKKPDWSNKDVNTYDVKYSPPRGAVHGTGSANLEGPLVEAVCGLREHHTDKSRAISVEVQGKFPQKYLDEIKELFGLYSKAEGVKVGFSFRSWPSQETAVNCGVGHKEN